MLEQTDRIFVSGMQIPTNDRIGPRGTRKVRTPRGSRATENDISVHESESGKSHAAQHIWEGDGATEGAKPSWRIQRWEQLTGELSLYWSVRGAAILF